MASWATPSYSRGEVNAAGATLIESSASIADDFDAIMTDDNFWDAYGDALAVINNWRSSHSYPLHVLTMTLRTRAKKVNGAAIIAQRLKRLHSITIKLSAERNMHMKLSQMQDLGGCRAIMPTVQDVEELVQVIEKSNAKNPKGRPELIKKYDYIAQPKIDGYRCVHFVYKYRTKSAHLEAFDGLRIEIQLRSQLQHAWATAVETVSTFTGQALKSNVGSDDWKRFFALMGSVIANREDKPLAPGTPTDIGALIVELNELSIRLKVEELLNGWRYALRSTTEKDMAGASAYLLVLDPGAKTIDISGYTAKQAEKASQDYIDVEKARPNVQAVLVSVESLATLRSAYPNYYLDTNAFLDVLRLAIH